jgi:hypothetical protein
VLSSRLSVSYYIIYNNFLTNNYNSKIWKNQRIYASTSNYYTHFRNSHKNIDLKALKASENNSKLFNINLILSLLIK